MRPLSFQALARHLCHHRHAGVVLAGVAAALLPGSCSPTYLAPPVTPELSRHSPAPSSLLERGFRVHQENCAKCHPFENPAGHDAGKLTRQILPEMARKAKLDPSEHEALLAYLLAARQLQQAEIEALNFKH